MTKNTLKGSFFDSASGPTPTDDDDVISGLTEDDNKIPFADDDEEEEEDEEQLEEKPKPVSKKKASSKKDAEEEEEEDSDEEEEEEEEEESDEDDDDKDKGDELSKYETTALELIDKGVFIPKEGKSYADSPIGVAELAEDTAEAIIKAKVAPGYESILDAMELGIPANEWAANMNTVPYEDADLTDTDTQEYLVRKGLELQGYDKDKIDKKVARYIKEDSLEEEAEENQALLIKNEEKSKAEYAKQVEAAAKERRDKQTQYISTIKQTIEGTKEIAGFFLTKKDQKELTDYIIKPVNPKGETQYMIDRNDPKKLTTVAYLAMKGIDTKKLSKVEKSKLARELRDTMDSKSDRASSSKGRTPKEVVKSNKMSQGMPWDRNIEIED